MSGERPPRGSKEYYGKPYFELGPEDGGWGGYKDFDTTRGFYHEYCELMDLAFGIRDQTLLDVGCAKGISVDEYLGRGANAWGTDITEWGVQAGPYGVRARMWSADLGSPWDVWTADKPSNAPDIFWLVACVETIEHVFPWRVPLAITNLARMTEQWLYLTIPAGDAWDRNDEHVCIRSAQWWRTRFHNVWPALVQRDDMEQLVRSIRIGNGKKMFKEGNDDGVWPWYVLIYEKNGDVPERRIAEALTEYEAGEALHREGRAKYDGYEPLQENPQ